jgi:hypothetical protein
VQSHISCTLKSHTFSTTNLQTTISIWNNNTSEHLTRLDGRIPTGNKRDKCLVVTKAFVTSIVTCRCLPWRSFNSDVLVATRLDASTCCKDGARSSRWEAERSPRSHQRGSHSSRHPGYLDWCSWQFSQCCHSSQCKHSLNNCITSLLGQLAIHIQLDYCIL